MIFGTMNAVGFIFTLFLPETKGLSLEEIDVLFKVVDEPTRRHDIEEHVGISAVVRDEKDAAVTASSTISG